MLFASGLVHQLTPGFVEIKYPLKVRLRLFALPCDTHRKIGKQGAVKVIATLLDLSKRFQEPIRLPICRVVDVRWVHDSSQFDRKPIRSALILSNPRRRHEQVPAPVGFVTAIEMNEPVPRLKRSLPS